MGLTVEEQCPFSNGWMKKEKESRLQRWPIQKQISALRNDILYPTTLSVCVAVCEFSIKSKCVMMMVFWPKFQWNSSKCARNSKMHCSRIKIVFHHLLNLFSLFSFSFRLFFSFSLYMWSAGDADCACTLCVDASLASVNHANVVFYWCYRCRCSADSFYEIRKFHFWYWWCIRTHNEKTTTTTIPIRTELSETKLPKKRNMFIISNRIKRVHRKIQTVVQLAIPL